MTGTSRPWRVVRSLVVWWVAVAASLWLLGRMLDQPASLLGCAASSAFFVAVGEAGDWLRRRWRAGRSVSARGGSGGVPGSRPRVGSGES